MAKTLQQISDEQVIKQAVQNEYTKNVNEYDYSHAKLDEMGEKYFKSQVNMEWSSVQHAGSHKLDYLENNGYGPTSVDTSSITSLRC